MQERLESLFGRAAPGWVPPADLAEYADQYVLTLEVPGVRREDIHLGFEAGTLTVRGHRPGPCSGPDRFHQLERGQGTFSRAFELPRPVVGTAIRADLARGVLTVTIPKDAASERRIEVS